MTGFAQAVDGGLNWRLSRFAELSTADLYQILQLRQTIFIVEQSCSYHDIDDWDSQATHLQGRDSAGQLIAYCRIFAPDVRFPEASIGRVLVAESARGRGLGHKLLQRSVRWCQQQFPATTIRIGAQAHLQAIYGRLGFRPHGQQYPVDGIPHIDLLLPPPGR